MSSLIARITPETPFQPNPTQSILSNTSIINKAPILTLRPLQIMTQSIARSNTSHTPNPRQLLSLLDMHHILVVVLELIAIPLRIARSTA
jgi:hypothetical protein